MFNIRPRKQVSPHLRGATKPYMYRKPAGKIYTLKQHKGTFSLSDQIILHKGCILEYIKVKGITIKNGVKQGHIHLDSKLVRVKQLGVRAWVSK